jgi:Uma2 family endonuclease
MKRSNLATSSTMAVASLFVCKDDFIDGSLQTKMQEYLANGAVVGLLLDPKRRVVERYGVGEPVAVLQNPSQVAIGPMMPGFVLSLQRIF